MAVRGKHFPPMRALESITGHVIYNPAYTYKTTFSLLKLAPSYNQK